MVALLMGLVGFGFGLFFGWALHRERVTRAGSVPGGGDQATAAPADASAQLELADQDVAFLRAQLSDAQQLLDERAATIADLEAELAKLRASERETRTGPASPDKKLGGETVEEDAVAEPGVVGVADVVSEGSAEEFAEAVTTSDASATLDDTDVAEGDVTDELVAPATAEGEEVATPPVVEEEAEPEPVDESVETTDEIERARIEEPVVATDDIETAEVEEPVEDVAPEDVVVDAEPDDLRRIRGIGPAMERLLNEQGIVTFRQLALLDEAGIKELEAGLPGVPGRIRRDRWVEQARDLHVQTHGDQP